MTLENWLADSGNVEALKAAEVIFARDGAWSACIYGSLAQLPPAHGETFTRVGAPLDIPIRGGAELEKLLAACVAHKGRHDYHGTPAPPP